MNAIVDARAVVRAVDGGARANSRDIAAAFEKDHRNVLRSIDQLVEHAPDFSALNFERCDYLGDNGRRTRCFEMTRDGFSMLAMGFTGQKALDWKVAFIEAFNAMEAALKAAPANDDPDAPGLLTTQDQRDRVRTAITMVRQMQALRGRRAAMELWGQLGLPQPRTEEEAKPVTKARVWEWARDCGVSVSLTVEQDQLRLWEHYMNWASNQGRPFLEPYPFNAEVRKFFDIEGKRGKFPLAVERSPP